MSLSCKLFNRDLDFSTMEEWYNKRNYLVIDKQSVSDYGFTVSYENVPVCTMFLYPVLSCDWCMIRFPISNPDIDKQIRDVCMDYLFTVIFDTARSMGYKKVFCTTNNEALHKRLLKFNLVPQNQKCEHYWGEL